MRMRSDVLFHPYHVIPAVELIAALCKSSDHGVAHVLMELHAVFYQEFIVTIARRKGDAGVDV